MNRAVSVAMRDGPAAGLALVAAILMRGDLQDYHLAHSAEADRYRRLGRLAEARASYSRALSLAKQGPARHFLERRLRELAESGCKRRRREPLEEAVKSNEEAVRLSSELYRAGLTDFLAVIDAQRELYANEDLLVQSRTAQPST